jgi:hypothetical protein
MRLSAGFKVGVVLAGGALTLVAANRATSARDALPGDVPDRALVEETCARVGQACVKTGTPCMGIGVGSCPVNPPTGACFPYSAGPPEWGVTAACSTCLGSNHNTCSGPALPPPPAPQCWETTVFCCNLTNACTNIAGGCACLPTAGAKARNTRIVCWTAPPAPGGGQPTPPDPIPDPG